MSATVLQSPEYVELPIFGLTLLPPWWCYVLWGTKRWENRAPSVANAFGSWRGNVLLTASKQPKGNDWKSVYRTSLDVGHDMRWHRVKPIVGESPTFEKLKALSGKALCVAELSDVRGYDRLEPWAVDGQVGLVLGKVWEVEPLPSRGGVGCWRVRWCRHCHAVVADNAKAGATCFDCGQSDWLASDGPRPRLEVVRECTI